MLFCLVAGLAIVFFLLAKRNKVEVLPPYIYRPPLPSQLADFEQQKPFGDAALATAAELRQALGSAPRPWTPPRFED